jgi:hypothetical protein
MKWFKLMIAIPFVMLGCNEDIGAPPNSATFLVLNSKKDLSMKSFESKNVLVMTDDLGNPEGIKVLMGRGVTDVGMGDSELAFLIVKTFTLAELGISPDEAWDFTLTQEHVLSVFSANHAVINEEPWDVTPNSEDGVYLAYLMKGERFKAVSSTLINNEEVHSTFVRGTSQSSNHEFRAKMNFDLYFQSNQTGDFLRLEQGTFTVTFDL